MKLYRGIVTNNSDPKNAGRVQVRLFELHGVPDNLQVSPTEEGANVTPNSDLPWAEVIQPIDFIGFSSTQKTIKGSSAPSVDGTGTASESNQTQDYKSGNGYNRIIDVGVWVFCILENGNPSKPLVLGTIASQNEYTNSSASRVYDSPTGHYEEFNDTDGKILIHNRNGNEILINDDFNLNSNAKLKIYSKTDTLSHSDANRKEYTKSNKTDTIDGNYELTLKGNSTNTIQGNLENTVSGNLTQSITGNITVQGAMITETSNGVFKLSGSMIMLN